MKDVTFTRKTVKVLPLNKQFLDPELLYTPGNLDKFLVGLATQPSQKFDNVLSEQVTNHLLQPKDKSFGLDLVALNIQRGRDHGLQGYNAFRELCGLGNAKSFDRLANLIPRNIVQKMKEIYESVDDVDLFIGGISETPAPGSILGPTFQVHLTIFKLCIYKADCIFNYIPKFLPVYYRGSVQETSAWRQAGQITNPKLVETI